MTSNKIFSSDIAITSSVYAATDNDAYSLYNGDNANVTISSNIYIAGGGGSGGTNGSGNPGKNALVIYNSRSVSVYNYGYLLGGGGGGGGGYNSQYNCTGGTGGAGGGGGGGGGSGGSSNATFSLTFAGTGGNGLGFNNTGFCNGSGNSGGGGGGSYYNSGGKGASSTYGTGGNNGTGSIYGGGGGGGGSGFSFQTGGSGQDSTISTYGGSGGAGSSSSGGGAGGAGGGAGGAGGNDDDYGSGYGGGGGGGCGGGLGGSGGSGSRIGGYGGSGIICDLNNSSYTLTNAQGIEPYNNDDSIYYGPLYISGCPPITYYIYITSGNCYGQLFYSSQITFNTIYNFSISSECYANIQSCFTSIYVGNSCTLSNVFYNTSHVENLTFNSWPSASSPYTFTYGGIVYNYYLSKQTAGYDDGINLTIVIVSVVSPSYSTYGNNSIECSYINNNTLSLNGSLQINPSYSTIIGMQFGTSTGTGTVNGEITVTFKNSFPSSFIAVFMTTPFVVGNLVCPQLSTVTSSGFSWYAYYIIDGTNSVSTNGSYTINWMAICYA